MEKSKNAINWFEIPVTNFERARSFYSKILAGEIKVFESPGVKMGFLPADQGAVTGSIIFGENYVPSDKGTLLYLNGGGDLSSILDRVEGAGGKIVLSKTPAGEYGFVAKFKDTEGNLVALHNMP
jgi:predicted enzyme related to lactoylglutathione lyase